MHNSDDPGEGSAHFELLTNAKEKNNRTDEPIFTASYIEMRVGLLPATLGPGTEA